MRSVGKVLLSAEIIFFVVCAVLNLAVAQTACVPPPAGLVHWWPADGNAEDIIGGNSYTGTIMGSTTFGAGKSGQAFDFNGTDAYVYVPSQSDLNVGITDFTVTLWIKPHSWTSEQAFVEKWYQPIQGSDSAYGWSLSWRYDGLILSYGDGRTDNHPSSCADTCLIQGGTFPPTEIWYHLALKREGSSLSIYRDGVNVGTMSYSFIYNLDTPAGFDSSLKFGARGNGQYADWLFFHGMVDEIQMYDGALSDEEIMTIYNAGSVGMCKGFTFSGFFPPVDNLPVWNAVNAGRAIPVKFSLDGYQGLNIFASGSPGSQKITCDTSAPVDSIEETATPGASSLSYDPSTDQYTYVWKTLKSWAPSCRQFIMQLIDGSSHVANFQFK